MKKESLEHHGSPQLGVAPNSRATDLIKPDTFTVVTVEVTVTTVNVSQGEFGAT